MAMVQFEIKDVLEKLLKEQQKTNELLQKLNEKLKHFENYCGDYND